MGAGTRRRAQNVSGYAARLLKRADQCKAVCACARLSWQVSAWPKQHRARLSRLPPCPRAPPGHGNNAVRLLAARGLGAYVCT